jgi:soluble lytic murein transglycosylase-like protein
MIGLCYGGKGQGMRADIRRALGLAATVVAALTLYGCSMAGLNLAPATKSLAVAKAETPAAAVDEESFEPLAFAEGSRRGSAKLDDLIAKYAGYYDVPEALVHRVVKRESGYNPGARNGSYYGLMQISAATARTMGYRGTPAGLLDPDTNLRFAVKYLRGAYIVGGYSQEAAVRHYARGYYYDAKRMGLLEETGLRN